VAHRLGGPPALAHQGASSKLTRKSPGWRRRYCWRERGRGKVAGIDGGGRGDSLTCGGAGIGPGAPGPGPMPARRGGRARLCWGWPVVALLLCPGPWACAGEKPKGPSEQEIKDLIAQLVSPNPRPIIRNTSFRLPKGWDRDKQVKVCEAFQKL